MNWRDIVKKSPPTISDDDYKAYRKEFEPIVEERKKAFKEFKELGRSGKIDLEELMRRKRKFIKENNKKIDDLLDKYYPRELGDTKTGKRRVRAKNKRELGLTDEEAKRIRAGVSPEEHKKILERGERRLREKNS